MHIDQRRTAVALAGFCSFLNLYAPQSVLPLLARELGATPADVSMTLTATTLAVALIAPFAGTVADVVGRKRIIVTAMFVLVFPTIMVAFAPTIHALIGWRFVQGLVLPPIFAVTVAYIGEEWPPAQAAGVTGLYISASGLGGFFGRFISGIAADFAGWHSAFLLLAAMTLVFAVAVAMLLPKEQHFRGSSGLSKSTRQMLHHLRKPQLLAIYAVGFGVLFTFIATFTYVNFLLAAPPFHLSSSMLGSIFVVYLAGSIVTPLTGRAVARFGRRTIVLAAIALAIAGLLVTLLPSLPAIVAGLTIVAMCGFMSQAVSTSFVPAVAPEGTSSAVGLYVSFYYIGGSAGAALPGFVWNVAGWPGCVAMVIAAMLAMATIVALFWREKPVISA
ncbi:MAG TPA: MFS transporter [Xanthobacteraceae bacterium]|jgi:predicted MFS family arabinose efflux permease|nr:MFS transporter [Xanthobacteraceae bacterium]